MAAAALPPMRAWLPATALAVLLYGVHEPQAFVYDDAYAIVDNALVSGPPQPARTWLADLLTHDFWGTPLDSAASHKSFRPLATASFRASHLLHGPSPRAFYLENVAAYALVTALSGALVHELCAEQTVGRRGAALAAALFAVHPVHVEAVCNLVNRAELLAAACVLAYLWLLARTLRALDGSAEAATAHAAQGAARLRALRRGVRSTAALCVLCVLGVCASLCKETGLMAGALGLGLQLLSICTALAEACGGPSRPRSGSAGGAGLERPRAGWRSQGWWRAHAGLACVQLGWALLFLYARRGLHRDMPTFHPAHNPASHLRARACRAANYAVAAAHALWLVAWPRTACPDYSAASIPLLRSAFGLDLADGAPASPPPDPASADHTTAAGERWPDLPGWPVAPGWQVVSDDEGRLLLALGTHAAWLTLGLVCAARVLGRARSGMLALARQGAARPPPHAQGVSEGPQAEVGTPRSSPPTLAAGGGEARARGGDAVGSSTAARGPPSRAARRRARDVVSGSATPSAEHAAAARASEGAVGARVGAPLLPSASSAALFALALLVVPLLPTWNLLHPVGFVVAERVLLVPSLGAAMLLGLCAGRLMAAGDGHGTRLARAALDIALLGAIAACAFVTAKRTTAWISAETLWASALERCPRACENVVVTSNAAFTLFAGRGAAPAAQGVALLRRAMPSEPRYAPLHTNLCMLLGQLERWGEALEACETAVQLNSADPIGHINLAAVLSHSGRDADARRHASHALALAPHDARVIAQHSALLAAPPRRSG